MMTANTLTSLRLAVEAAPLDRCLRAVYGDALEEAGLPREDALFANATGRHLIDYAEQEFLPPPDEAEAAIAATWGGIWAWPRNSRAKYSFARPAWAWLRGERDRPLAVAIED